MTFSYKLKDFGKQFWRIDLKVWTQKKLTLKKMLTSFEFLN